MGTHSVPKVPTQTEQLDELKHVIGCPSVKQTKSGFGAEEGFESLNQVQNPNEPSNCGENNVN